ncbi:MAG: HlyC/CorC family transporter [Planctomycetes bacterium]|nr:HlyC/CorC family transporter [Planctomycetota bacterium]
MIPTAFEASFLGSGAEDPFPAVLREVVHLAPATLAAAAVGLAAFGAVAAACLIGYSPSRLDQELEEARRPDREALAAEIDARDTEYLTVATAYTAAGWVLGLWAILHATDPDLQPIATAAFVTCMLLLAGCLPFAIAQVRAERTLLSVLPAVRAGWFVLRWPLVLPLLLATRGCLAVLRLRPKGRPDTADVQKQVIAAVADSVTEDSLAHDERTWIGNIVGLKDLQVSTLMTPRADIVGVPESLPLRAAVQKAQEDGFSRYPVYRDRIDVVVGVFYAKDALRLLQADDATLEGTQVRTMMRDPLFVPETMGAAQLLRRFQAGNQHMAIVLDEYGTTAGLVTVEDLIEAIVGDIADEYDNPPIARPRDEQIEVVEAGRVLDIPARTTVAELNQMLDSRLPEDGDWETVAGMVITKCNHIPTVGETVAIEGVEFRVLAADERRIQRLRATVLAPASAEEAQ